MTQNPKKDWTKSDVLIYVSPESKERLDNSRGNKNFDPNFLKKVITEETEKITNAMIENFQKRN